MAMADYNSVVVVGRLTKDIDIRYMQSGSAVGNMSVAVNRRVKKGDTWETEADFFDVTLYGKIAEGLKDYLTKGKQILVGGTLRQERWEKDGQKFSKVKIVADTVQLLGGKSDNNSGNGDSKGDDFPEDIPYTIKDADGIPF